MSFSALQKAVTYLLAGIGLVSLAFGGELPWTSLAVLAAGFVASWFVEAPLVDKPAWSRTWTGLLFAALFVQVFRSLTAQGGWLGCAMEFAGLLTVSRLFNRRSAADYQQIAMLAFMQLIAATVLTTDLGYAGVFVTFVIVTPWALTLAHMRHEIERNYPKQPEPDGSSDVRRVLASRRIVSPMFLVWTALLSVPMLVMTLALFVVFPRVGLGFVSLGSQRGQHVTGFGNKVELGGFGVIRDDPTVVLRVTPSRPLTVEEQHRYLRLRGTAFDHYDGRKWTRSEGQAVRMSPMGEYYLLKRMSTPKDLSFQIILDRLDEPVLFVPPGAVGLHIPFRGVPGAFRERMTIVRGHGLDLRYRSPDELGVVYDVLVSRDPAELDVPVARDMDDERYLQMPAGHERVAALARKLTEGLTSPADIAARLESHLRDNERYAYSTAQPDTGGKRPLEVFLFEAKRGHCEYFATALAIMLRSLGIPARNVTGFVGGEYNRYGGYFAIRQADAHSWVEALLPDHGWVTLDPTPGARDDIGPARWLFRDVSAMLDALRAQWMMRVVGYDLRTQLRSLREIRAFFRSISLPDFSLGKRGAARQDDGQHATSRTDGSLVLAMLGGVVLLALLAIALVRLVRRRNTRLVSISAREAQALYRKLERVLEKQGRARPAHVTPEAHARELERQGFTAARAVVELTDLYVKARYGGVTMPRERVRKMREHIGEVKRAA